MSSAATQNRSRGRKKKRGVTRRVRDEHGNIVVKRYVKKQSRLRIPGISWRKVPSLLVGLPISAFAGAVYAFKKGNLSSDGAFEPVYTFLDSQEGLNKLLLTGTLAIGLSTWLGFSLLTKGFKVRKWPAAFRQLVALWAVVIITTAVVSPFINEPGLIRQQDDKDFVINNSTYNIDNLNSPFFSELLNGLLDLLGNIPDPQEEVAFITANDGQGLSYQRDRYLYRWRVAETYSDELKDFENGYASFQNDYNDFSNTYQTFNGTGFTSLEPDNARKLLIKEQYLTISSSYIGEALTPWNSEFGAMIGDPSQLSLDLLPGMEGQLIQSSLGGYRDINEQPSLSMAFDQARTQGYLGYDSYWVQDDKEAIANEAIPMSEIQTALNAYKNNAASRFGDLESANAQGIDGIWGINSLPGGTEYVTAPGSANFQAAYDNFKATLQNSIDNGKELSAYDMAIQVSNQIQQAVIEALDAGTLNIDPTQASGVADDGADKAYWFYDALNSNGNIQFGMKEVLAAFTNMLRSLGIPARPILGFSVGEFQYADGSQCFDDQCDQITIKFKNVHVWIEALIPRSNGQGGYTYSWGIFNPIPDPWIAGRDATDLAYGKNALGGNPDIDLEITTGKEQSIGQEIDLGPLGKRDSFMLNKIDNDLVGRVRVSYDGIPAGGQTVSLRLVKEDILSQGGELDPNIGIELKSVVTSSTDGWGEFRLFPARNGSLYQYNADGTIDPNPVNNVTIGAIDPLAELGSIGIYGIIAIFGLSGNFTITGWELDINFDMTANRSFQSMINPEDGKSIDTYGVLLNNVVTFQVTATDNQSQPVDGLDNIKLLFLSQTAFTALTAALQQGILLTQTIDDNTQGIFSTTNSQGIGNFTLNFDQTFASTYPMGNAYVAVALMQQGLIYTSDFVWFSNELGLQTELQLANGTAVFDDTVNFTNGMLDSTPISWNMVTNTTAFVESLFPEEQASQIPLTYYIIEQGLFDASVTGLDPNIDYVNLNNDILSTCTATTGPVTTCFRVTVDGTNIPGISLTGDLVTASNGIAIVNVTLQNIAFAVGYYYFAVVSTDFQTFDYTVRFFSASPPAILSQKYSNSFELINVASTPVDISSEQSVDISSEQSILPNYINQNHIDQNGPTVVVLEKNKTRNEILYYFISIIILAILLKIVFDRSFYRRRN